MAYSDVAHLKPNTIVFRKYALGLRPFSPDDLETQMARYKKADAFFSNEGVVGLDPTALDGVSDSAPSAEERAATQKKKMGVKEQLEALRVENAGLQAELKKAHGRVGELEFAISKVEQHEEELEDQAEVASERIEALGRDVRSLHEKSELSSTEAARLHRKLQEVMMRELSQNDAFGGPLPEINFGPRKKRVEGGGGGGGGGGSKRPRPLKRGVGTNPLGSLQNSALQRIDLQASLSEAKLMRRREAEAKASRAELQWFEDLHQQKASKLAAPKSAAKLGTLQLQRTPVKPGGSTLASTRASSSTRASNQGGATVRNLTNIWG